MLCSSDILTVLKEKWIKNVSSVFKNDSFDKFTGRGRILFLLPKLNEKLAIELITSSIETNEGLDRFALSIGPAGQDSVKGTYAHVKTEFFDRIGGSELIKNRVKERIESKSISDPELNTIYKSIITGKPIYYIDNTEARDF